MTEKIAQFDDENGLSFKDAIAEASKRKLRILSNLEVDERLKGDQWEKEKEMYPCWTGTLIIYEKPGVPFGKVVEHEGLRALVPKEFQGKKDMAIVCNHPDFLSDGKDVAIGKGAKLVPFPKEDGWYLPDPEFGIPSLEKGEDDGKRRYLWRWTSQAHIGLVARHYYGFLDWFRRFVVADFGPGFRLGVFGAASGKVTPPKHKHEWICRSCGVSK
jgi:hypothetical protein